MGVIKPSEVIIGEQPREKIVFHFVGGVQEAATLKTKRADVFFTGVDPTIVEGLQRTANLPDGEPFLIFPGNIAPAVADSLGVTMDSLSVQANSEGILVKGGAIRVKLDDKGIKLNFINK
ncbi:MAG: hypothetical protein WAV41_04175 [Microgenomates group bacterium]